VPSTRSITSESCILSIVSKRVHIAEARFFKDRARLEETEWRELPGRILQTSPNLPSYPPDRSALKLRQQGCSKTPRTYFTPATGRFRRSLIPILSRSLGDPECRWRPVPSVGMAVVNHTLDYTKTRVQHPRLNTK